MSAERYGSSNENNLYNKDITRIENVRDFKPSVNENKLSGESHLEGGILGDQRSQAAGTLFGQLESCSNLEDLLKFFTLHEKQFDFNVKVRFLCILDEKLASQNKSTIDKLASDTRFQQILQDVLQQRNTLNEEQRVSVLSLSWRCNINTKELLAEAEENIQQNKYKVPNIIKLISRFEQMHYSSPGTIQYLLQQITEFSYKLNAQQSQILLYVLAAKRFRFQTLTKNDVKLAYECIKILQPLVPSLSNTVNARIFYHLLVLQLHLHEENGIPPEILIQLCKSVQLKSLPAQELLLLSKVHSRLPVNFPGDFFDGLCQRIITETQSTPTINLSFFVQIISQILNTNVNAFSAHQRTQIKEYLELLIKQASLKPSKDVIVQDQIIQLLKDYPIMRSSQLNNSLKEFSKGKGQTGFLSLVEYLIFVNEDVSNYLLDLKSLGYDNQAFRYYLIFKTISYKDTAFITELETKMKNQIQSDLKGALLNFLSSKLVNFEGDQQEQEEDQGIQQNIKNSHSENKQIEWKKAIEKLSMNLTLAMQEKPAMKELWMWRGMLKLNSQKAARISWLNYLTIVQKQCTLLPNSTEVMKILQALSSVDQFGVNEFITFNYLAHSHLVSLQTLLTFAVDTPGMFNSNSSINIQKYANLIRTLLKTFSNSLSFFNDKPAQSNQQTSRFSQHNKSQNGNINSPYDNLDFKKKSLPPLILFYSLFYQLSSKRFTQQVLITLLRQAFVAHSADFKHQNKSAIINSAIALIKYDQFPEDMLINFYLVYHQEVKKLDDQATFLSAAQQFLYYTKKATQNQKEFLDQSTQKIFAKSQEILCSSEPSLSSQILGLKIFFSFSLSVSKIHAYKFQDYFQQAEGTLQSIQNQINPEQFLELINSFHLSDYSIHQEYYKRLLQPLMKFFFKNIDSFHSNEVIGLLKKFADWKCLQMDLINGVISFSSKNFEFFTFEEMVDLMCSFCELKIIHVELFTSIFECILKNPSVYRGYSHKITQGLFSVGFQSQQSADALLAIAKSDSVNYITDIKELYLYLSYFLSFSDIPMNHVKEIYSLYQKGQQNINKSNQQFNRNVGLQSSRQKGKPHMYHFVVERLMQELLPNQYFNDIGRSFGEGLMSQQGLLIAKKPKQPHLYMSIALKALGVEHNLSHLLRQSQITCDIFLPKLKKAISLQHCSMFAYDEITPCGKISLVRNYTQILEKDNVSVILLNFPTFKHANEHAQAAFLSKILERNISQEEYLPIFQELQQYDQQNNEGKEELDTDNSGKD